MLTQRLPAIASSLLLLALAFALYLQLLPVFTGSDDAQSSPSVPNAQDMSANLQQQQNRRHDIVRFDLFGSAQKTTEKVAEVVPDKLPATTLKLKLTGILSTEEDVLTGALIEGPDRDTSYYKPGDALPGDAVLKQVHADRVVIDRGGRFENLYFPEEFSSATFTTTPEPQEEVYQDTSYTEPSEQAPEEITPQVSEAQKNSIKDRLSKLRSRINTNQR